MTAAPIVLVKLGGSLITEKTVTGRARDAAIRRLAREIAAWRRGHRGERLVLGHGSGSFGHPAAARGGLVRSADERPKLDSSPTTRLRAAALHQIVMTALRDAGAEPFSLAAGSFLTTARGRIAAAFLDPLFAALDAGLLPVVYGDVVLDRSRGAAVVSTEELFTAIAHESRRRRRPVSRAVWLGETDGVLDASGRTIARLSIRDALNTARATSGAAGVDVTGGMALRLRTAAVLAKAGIPSSIVDGRPSGSARAAIAGRSAGGTQVAAS